MTELESGRPPCQWDINNHGPELGCCLALSNWLNMPGTEKKAVIYNCKDTHTIDIYRKLGN